MTAPTTEAQAALTATSTADLLRKAYALTHRIHEWEHRYPGQIADDQRAARGLIDAEILRRTGEQSLSPAALPLHRTEAGYPRCSTCDGGGCPDCTDPA